MTAGKLNVYVGKVGGSCEVDNGNYAISVINCDGTVLNWSGGRYRYHSSDPWIPIQPHQIQQLTPGLPPSPVGWWYDWIPAPQGHVEIEVPCGKYVVVASGHTWEKQVQVDGFLELALYANGPTDRAIACVGCGEDVCVILYNPSVKSCWQIIGFVFPLMMEELRSKDQLTVTDQKAITDAVKIINEKLVVPLTKDKTTQFEMMHLGLLDAYFKKISKPKGR